MKSITKHLSLALLFSGVALSKERKGADQPKARAVEVVFSSSGSGIDERAFKQIFAIATESLASRKAALISSIPWGKEGEVALCIQMRDGIDAYQFQQSITSIIATDVPKKLRPIALLKLTCPVIE